MFLFQLQEAHNLAQQRLTLVQQNLQQARDELRQPQDDLHQSQAELRQSQEQLVFARQGSGQLQDTVNNLQIQHTHDQQVIGQLRADFARLDRGKEQELKSKHY